MEWVKTLALAIFMSSAPAWSDTSTFPESVDENGGKPMSATWADRALKGSNQSAGDVFPVSVDENPGMPMRSTYADRHRGDTRAARTGFPADADASISVPPRETRADRAAKSGG